MAEAPKKPDQGEDKKDEAGGSTGLSGMELFELLKQKLTFSEPEKPRVPQLLPDVSFDGIVKYIKSDKCRNIVTMAGAGISTSAGIPDFRSPGTGLYDNLQKYDLPNPQAIFEISFFRENPEPFFTLAKELYPGVFKPTPCHYFIKLLADEGYLLTHFTQNIDTLERVAGVPGDKIVEAHGTFHTSHCIDCQAEYSQDWMKDQIFEGKMPRCQETDCEGLVKPDIVFFGEPLPPKFFSHVKEDLPACDLLIILGTSLVVQPFASLVSRVKDTTPRLYINLEKSDCGGDPFMSLLGMGSGFMFDSEDNYRDIFWQGTCDDGCQALADALGWGKKLEDLVKREHARIDAETKAAKSNPAGATPLKSQKQNEKPESERAIRGSSIKEKGNKPKVGASPAAKKSPAKVKASAEKESLSKQSTKPEADQSDSDRQSNL